MKFLYPAYSVKWYLDFFDRRVSHELELIRSSTWTDLEKIYDRLPEEVRETPYGQKLKEIRNKGLWELEMYIKAIREYIRPLH